MTFQTRLRCRPARREVDKVLRHPIEVRTATPERVAQCRPEDVKRLETVVV